MGIDETNRYLGEHSTGLGAIFPNTARYSWQEYYNETGKPNTLPVDDYDLQIKLSTDNMFNLQTMILVLASEAKNLGYIRSTDELKNLTEEQWKQVFFKYNGGYEGNDEAKNYAEQVHEYLPYIKGYLSN